MRVPFRDSDIFSRRFLKFCVVGAANVLVDFLLYSLLLLAGTSPYLSRTLSWCGACLFSYLVNRSWTFKAGDRGFKPLVRFSVVNVCSLCLGLLLLFLFKRLGCGDTSAFFLSLPFTTAANYIGYRFWSFRLVDAK